MSELICWAVGIFVGLTFAFSRVTEQDFQKALDSCAANGGLEAYITSPIGGVEFFCKNGAKFKLNEGD